MEGITYATAERAGVYSERYDLKPHMHRETDN
jgi:hypothetical protein